MNGVKEEIRHVLDSEIARHGRLTPHQMYEAVKKYETYVARNKRLKGKRASPHTNHQRAVAQTSGYKPHFRKTTAFVASVKETTDSAPTELGPSLPEDEDHPEVGPNQKDDELKGPHQDKLAREMAKASLPGRATSQGVTPK